MKSVVIEVSTTGEITIQGKGFKGAECEAATKAMEEALGTVTGKKKTPEYYQQQTGTRSQST